MSARTLLVPVGPDADTPSVLLEFPKQDVDPGEFVTIRAWAPDPAMLAGHELRAGAVSLGPGRPNAWRGQTTCRYFDFKGDLESQRFDYPVLTVRRVLAFSPLFSAAGGSMATVAPAGTDVTGLFFRRGYSCLAAAPTLGSLYGTVHATAERTPHCREWFWTAPAAPAGAQWFFWFVDETLKHRFSISLSEDPPDTSVCHTDIKLRIIDRRTAGAVPGADVWLDGEYLGASDSRYGYVKRNRILSGTYPVRVAAAGYIASDADAYADNDTVTIPPGGGEVRIRIGG